jgi:putative CocE/NonD family hydrolase
MSFLSRLLGFLWDLPKPLTRSIDVTRDIEVPMPDGVMLLTDRYRARGLDERLPHVLVRSPYGRAAMLGLLYGRLFAERGYDVLIQSCRGTFGSGGSFDPFRTERADGLATVAWLKKQPWFSGKFGTIGPSYLGITQWAIAADAGPELGAMSVQMSTSVLEGAIYPGGAFWLDTALSWVYLVHHQSSSFVRSVLTLSRATAAVRPALAVLPFAAADEVVTGTAASYYRDWLAHEAGDPWWREVDFRAGASDGTAPVHMVAGQHDVFLPESITDYQLARDAGRKVKLTLGPWTHADPRWTGIALREALAWFGAHLSDGPSESSAPVRVFLGGVRRWRDLDDFPPPTMVPRPYYLQPEGGLGAAPPRASDPDRYRYDPADPTPSVGGASLSDNSGSKDNRSLEARADVLVYTSEPLEDALTVIGPVRASLWVASSLEHTDFFVRVCDVGPNGRSYNLSDGLLRLSPARPAAPDGRIEIELWPLAHVFQRGHRVRILIASGTHPRYARNLGSGEPLVSSTKLVAAEQTVFHDADRPSSIHLPVVEGGEPNH